MAVIRRKTRSTSFEIRCSHFNSTNRSIGTAAYLMVKAIFKTRNENLFVSYN